MAPRQVAWRWNGARGSRKAAPQYARNAAMPRIGSSPATRPQLAPDADEGFWRRDFHHWSQSAGASRTPVGRVRADRNPSAPAAPKRPSSPQDSDASESASPSESEYGAERKNAGGYSRRSVPAAIAASSPSSFRAIRTRSQSDRRSERLAMSRAARSGEPTSQP